MHIQTLKIYDYLNLDERTQQNVSFYNITLGCDNKIFIDYNRILNSKNKYALRFINTISCFTDKLGLLLIMNKRSELIYTLSNLGETNQTFFGYSKKYPDGNSIGKKVADAIICNFTNYKEQYLAGGFNLNMIQYTEDNIGPDKTSDMITKIILQLLVEFTIEECEKLNIKLTDTYKIIVFDIKTQEWVEKEFKLPTYNGDYIILTPNDILSEPGEFKKNQCKLLTLGFVKMTEIIDDLKLLKSNSKKGKLFKKQIIKHFKSLGYNSKSMIKKIQNVLPASEFKKILDQINNELYKKTDKDSSNNTEKFDDEVA